VALHRFLYDHWDSVRQRLSTHEKRFWKDSSLRKEADHMKRERCATLDNFTELVPSLGPPPMDISWNRPQISANVPPAYSRFQHFMLKNAGRNTESVISARVVYDGGESKVGRSLYA
jgi:neurofibromin 1